jgi:hypothetical protein
LINDTRALVPLPPAATWAPHAHGRMSSRPGGKLTGSCHESRGLQQQQRARERFPRQATVILVDLASQWPQVARLAWQSIVATFTA